LLVKGEALRREKERRKGKTFLVRKKKCRPRGKETLLTKEKNRFRQGKGEKGGGRGQRPIPERKKAPPQPPPPNPTALTVNRERILGGISGGKRKIRFRGEVGHPGDGGRAVLGSLRKGRRAPSGESSYKAELEENSSSVAKH